MHRLHNFMDKMREKTVPERQRLLRVSTISLGALIAVIGLWNIPNNLISLGGQNVISSDTAAKPTTPSLFATLSANIASVVGTAKAELKDLNDKLGQQN